MAVVFERIYSLDEIDYEGLFYDSLMHLDDNYPWPSYIERPKRKFEVHKQNIELMMQLYGEKLFMYKAVVNGVNGLLYVGVIDEENKTLNSYWNLTRADATGSRNWLYTLETETARNEFLRRHGIEFLKLHMIKNSSIHRFILSRPQAITVIKEEDDPGKPLPGGETYDAVIVTIKLNDRSSQ